MGLDTYASRAAGDVELTDEDERAFEEAAPQLCGGIVSGAMSSFRGKIYDTLILEATGYSLYEEWIAPEMVKAMSAKLGAYAPAQLAAVSEKVDGDFDPKRAHGAAECAELQKFFRICAERGLGLVGWW